jgi:hypothetical protein
MATSQVKRFDADESPGSVLERFRRFSFTGAPTVVEEREGVPFLFNEFWTARQRQAHRIHEISYRACFKPQLPAFFIEALTEPGDAVHDPFMGRGTTPIQAALMGRRPVGADINPLSVLLTRPRLSPPPLAAIERRLTEIDWQDGERPDLDLAVFYHPETLIELTALRRWLLERQAADAIDPVDDWIRMIALNRLTGHSSGFFSVYTLPPNQAVSIEAQRKINRARGQTPPRRSVPAIILKKSRTLLGDPVPYARAPSELMAAPAEATPAIADGSIRLVVTSPPFLDVVQYDADNWLRCWFAGIEPAGVPIAMHRDPEAWTGFVRGVMRELVRVLAPGGHIAFEVGEVRGGKIELERLVLAAAAGLTLVPVCVLINAQSFTKTANCWGVSNNRKGTNTNRIVLLQKR